jgi:myo-inositol-1(or 4)-monophosphatase
MSVARPITGPSKAAELDRRQVFLERTIREAGVIASRGFADVRDNGFSLKGPQDFLTETDGAVEAFLRNAFAASCADDGFLGEEGGGAISLWLWVVDPIDGTANFARGIPHYCISIALVVDGVTELGAILNPELGDLYCARRGGGTTRNGQPVRAAATASFASASVELGWSNRIPNARYLQALAAILERGANVRRGSSGALALAYVAAGHSDGYAEIHMNAWDCLAGLLMVTEAGGVVDDFLARGGLEAGGPVFAAAPGIADELRRSLASDLFGTERRDVVLPAG